MFIKLGCIKDEDFYSKVKDIIIFKDLNGEYKTLSDFVGKKDAAEGEEKEEEEKKEEENKEPATIYYVSDEAGQAQYVAMFKNAGLNAIVCDTFIDPHFISYLEYKETGKYRFLRIDADVAAALKEGESKAEDNKELTEAFKAALKNTKIAVKAEKLKNAEVPAIINVAEFSRRFGEMNAFYGLAGADAEADMTIVINTANAAVQKFLSLDDEKRKFVANQIYYMAMLSYKKLSPEEMQEFSQNNMSLLSQYIG